MSYEFDDRDRAVILMEQSEKEQLQQIAGAENTSLSKLCRKALIQQFDLDSPLNPNQKE